MAIDIAAKLAQLRARKQAETKENENEKISRSVDSNIPTVVADNVSISETISRVGSNSSSVNTTAPTSAPSVPQVNVPVVLGTAKTSEIDHLDFLSKMNKLAEMLITKHPTMPVLLKQIHTQLRNDPELVTTLDEDAIGIVVSGLQVVTKTELIQEKIKESKSKTKKIALSVDML